MKLIGLKEGEAPNKADLEFGYAICNIWKFLRVSIVSRVDSLLIVGISLADITLKVAIVI